MKWTDVFHADTNLGKQKVFLIIISWGLIDHGAKSGVCHIWFDWKNYEKISHWLLLEKCLNKNWYCSEFDLTVFDVGFAKRFWICTIGFHSWLQWI